MKNFAILTIFLVTLLSCHPDKVLTNESKTFSTTDSAMMIQAKDFNGFAGFKILQTTDKDFKSMLKRQADKNYLFDSDATSNFLSGYFSSSFEESEFIEKSKIIKQYYISKYFFGEIEIDQISLLFYKDTLVGIHVDHCDEEIIGMLAMKYGEGQGMKRDFGVKKWNNASSKYDIHINSYEKRLWKNDKVEANYDYSFSTGRFGGLTNSLLIIDITGSFKAFEDEYSRLKSEFQNKKANDYQKTLKNI